MNDSYMHVDGNVMYVEENIPGPPENGKEYKELISAFNSQITNFCKCKDTCSSDCNCIQSSGGKNYVSNDDSENLKFRLDYELKDFKKYSIIECNSLCSCSLKCGNRVVQHGPREGIIIQKCEPESKGLGLFTKSFIPKGTFICEYAGEIITKAQALTRQNKNKREGKMNYIYCLNEHSTEKVVQTFIDPSNFGNIGRYMNHSCEANCEVIPVRIDSPVPKLAIFSCVDILPNTELTFNYGAHDLPSNPSTDETRNRKKCFCNSEKCTGFMPFDMY
ncbi:SET domain-containing protein [Phthorimaea operculella]|nr:SET domain-containing protein [Phthorimaea operculella]